MIVSIALLDYADFVLILALLVANAVIRCWGWARAFMGPGSFYTAIARDSCCSWRCWWPMLSSGAGFALLHVQDQVQLCFAGAGGLPKPA